MSNALRLPAGPGPSGRDTTTVRVTSCSDSSRRLSIRLPATRSHAHFASFSVQSSQPSIVSSHHHQQQQEQEQELTSTVGSSSSSALQRPPLITQQRHVHFLTFIACSVAVSATWLFCSAIPTLLAFKRAAVSMEKLMDVTREELPGTMAAVRLSGMEISDLTMELSDLGQEITQGVRSSTQAVRLAEERLRRLTNTTPIVTVQEVAAPTETPPALARTARGIREGIVKGRAVVQMFFTLTRYSKILLNYFKSRGRA